MRIVAPRLQVAYALFRVVEDDAHREPLARANPTDAMAYVHSISAACTFSRSVVDGEYYPHSSLKWYHLHSRLHARSLFGEREFAACKFLAGLRQQERDLKREDVFAVNILVQAVIVTCYVLEDQRCGLRLACLVAASLERLVLGRMSGVDTQRFVPSIADFR
jgi:hypothetical protein